MREPFDRTRHQLGTAILGVTTAMLLITAPLATGKAQAGIALEEVLTGLSHPVHLTHAGDGSARLFIVEQEGSVRVAHKATLLPTPFLDISRLVRSGGERGLLSIAFHPRYAENGFFYVNYTNRSGDTVVARYTVSADANRADPTTGVVLLMIRQPYSNHNGGQLQFGPDGYLYIGMGDGGSGGDPHGHAQNPNSLLGKMLRIDVNTLLYTIPKTKLELPAAVVAEHRFPSSVRREWFLLRKLHESIRRHGGGPLYGIRRCQPSGSDDWRRASDDSSTV